ncbi:MFS transporter [Sagittula sp. SSi028]|uniref:MFS transporter n=1 Tax=Sagittula sp. SSi028 TaxID=3400636 RepID=UPI003AF8923C
MTNTVTEVYDELTGAEDAPETEARNGLRHMISLSMTKVADGLIDPKLVLSWLGGAIGVPTAITGLFVPIREAGALLPQIILAGRVESMTHRKWAWVTGSAGQGLMAAVIAIAALLLEGWLAGVVIAAALAVLAVSRALCSVSYKDILGKTVPNQRRGAVTGTAATAASLAVLAFAAFLIFGPGQEQGPVIAAIALAAALWGVAALLFSRLEEKPSAVDGDQGGINLTPLREDKQFRRFIYTRGALTVTALAPPYFVLLGGGDAALSGLGAMLVASASASFVSSYIWGRLADRSSRWVLALSGFIAAAFMALAVALDLAGLAEPIWVIPLTLFGLMIAYKGVRQGRSTYLVDMAPEDHRSSYAALANTLIGTLLLVVGALGGALAFIGPQAALAGFAVLSVLGGMLALGLDEVEGG